jgi:hypothetical protein
MERRKEKKKTSLFLACKLDVGGQSRAAPFLDAPPSSRCLLHRCSVEKSEACFFLVRRHDRKQSGGGVGNSAQGTRPGRG